MEQVLTAVEEMGLKPRQIFRQVERNHIFTHIRWDILCVWIKAESAPFDAYSLDEIEEGISLPTAFKQCLGILK